MALFLLLTVLVQGLHLAPSRGFEVAFCDLLLRLARRIKDLNFVGLDGFEDIFRLLHVNVILFSATELGLVGCDDIDVIVEVLFLLCQLTVVLSRVLQVEELHEAEVLQVGLSILEERAVEFFILKRSQLLEHPNLKLCVPINIHANAVLISREELNDSLEEVRADFLDGLR